MAGTSVNALVSNLMSVNLSTSDNTSRIQTGGSDTSFESVMDRTSKETYKIQKKESKVENGSSVSTEMEKSNQIVRKLKEIEENEKTAVLEGVADAVVVKIDDLKAEIAAELGIELSELESLMEDMNLTDVQLFDVETLKNLVMEVNGFTTSQDMLFDSDSLDEFKNILAAMEECKTELNEMGVMVLEDGFYLEETNELLSVEESDKEIFGNSENSENVDEADVLEGEDVKASEMFEEQGKSYSEDDNTAKDNAPRGNDNREEIFATRMNTGVSLFNADPLVNIEEALNEKVGKTIGDSILNQIAEKIKLNVGSELKSIEMQLYPEHLGKVGIEVVAKEGMLAARIYAENEAVKNILETRLAELKESFNDQGLKVENVEITVASHSFEGNNLSDGKNQAEQNKGRKRRNISAFFEEIDDDMEETDEVELKEVLGHTVSYMA